MNRYQVALALKKQRLMWQSNQLRGALAQDTARLSPALAVVDRVGQLVVWARAHRTWLIGGAALAVLIRPRRGWGWVKKGLVVWGLYRRAHAAWQHTSQGWERLSKSARARAG